MFTLSGPVKLCVQDGGYSVELKEGEMRLHSQADLNVVVRAFFERVRKISLNYLSEKGYWGELAAQSPSIG